MNDHEKWNAVVQCDGTYDSVFFYGVKTTGIFCRPSCKSKLPCQDNVIFFDSSEDAIKYGLRPCKRCRPDLIEYAPMLELVEKAKLVIDNYFSERETVTSKLQQFGFSQNYLISLYRQRYGLTPMEHMRKLRLEKSKELLCSTDKNILEIALECGFGSISTYYEAFKKQVGMTPKEYRSSENIDC